jgi:mycothiol system anti-sigma-R factor
MSEVKALRCAGIQRFVDTYLDSEFADGDRAEFEQHLAECEPCRNRVKIQAEWKVAIRGASPRERAPAALRNRVQRAIAREAAGRRVKKSWRAFATRVLPVAAAAGLLGTFVVSKMQLSPVAADVIAKHQRNLPIEVSGGSEQVKRWYADKVGFPVKPPSLCKSCALRGGRLAEVANQQAAYLVYEVNGNKISVFIFDPASVPLQLPQRATVPATGGDREVYLDQEHGYNVAVFRDHGVGYAIAGDVDRDQMLKMVSSTVSPP